MNGWNVNVIGAYVIGKQESVHWEFTMTDAFFILGLVRVRDTKFLAPANEGEMKVLKQYQCGWFYHVASNSRYWAEVRPQSDYMGQNTIDRRYLAGDAADALDTMHTKKELVRIEMNLVGNTLTLALVGRKQRTPPHCEIDRSEPLVMACILKNCTLTIVNFSVSAPPK
jgi:hypothetical protein